MEMQTAFGVSAFGGLIVGAGYLLLSVLEKRNRAIYYCEKLKLEQKARHIPQSAEGEKVSYKLGGRTDQLESWAKKPWIARAIVKPNIAYKDEQSEVEDEQSEVEDEQSEVEDEQSEVEDDVDHRLLLEKLQEFKKVAEK